MNNNLNAVKYWNDEEEIQLINEINQLTNIDDILKNHNRKITGILMRIEKIFIDPIKSIKIINKKEIVDKYFTNNKNKYFINYEELYLNILKFNSIDDISNNYNKISHSKIKNILNDFLKKKDIDIAKKLRIKCLLKTKDDLDFAENIFKNENVNNNENISKNNNENNNTNINSVIISLLEEIKIMKTDIFDIKNRVKIIMEKVVNSDKNIIKKNSKTNNNLNIILNESDKSDKSDIKNDKKNEKKKHNNINKHVENIILSNDINELSEFDNDELEKEFKEFIN
jgi:hypothetical protein